ncbi:hypothetical protein D9M68_919770 [compost metagenome]
MPAASSSGTASASVFALVNRKSSCPLGRKTSVLASTARSASRMPGLSRISGLRFGSKDTVPPAALIISIAAIMLSTTLGA